MNPHPAHRILVVDDEPGVVASLEQVLRTQDYVVESVSSAPEAIPRLKESSFALILCDQRMPGMTGLELLARAKEMQPDATRVLMTGVVELKTLVEAINRGEIYRFVLKPWIYEELLVTIRNGVQRHDLIRHNAKLHQETVTMNQRLSEMNRSLEQQVAREADQNNRLAGLNLALQQNFSRSVQLCLRVMQTFYPGLGSQAHRVYELCRALADQLEMPPGQRHIFEVSAWLHDIGMLGLPRRLIRAWEKSPSLLKPADHTLLQQHPILGQELAGFIDHLSDVGAIIRAHHERFDGTGYPDGLAGENIPWLARLLAVAIAFAEGDDPSEALEHIRRGSGTAFDPEAIKVFEHHRPKKPMPRRERQVPFSELRAGMVLARGIYGANGLLLVAEGQTVNDLAIEKLQNHNRVNPITQSLVVYC